MIRGAIFDLGSTLIHFDGDWPTVMRAGLDALVASLKEQGAPTDAASLREAFRKEQEAAQQGRLADNVERTTASVLRQVLARLGDSAVPQEAIDRAVEALFAVSEQHWQPMPGAAPMLTRLKDGGLKLGMVSNASDAGNVRRLVEKAQLGPWFDPIVVSASVGRRKPDPSLFESILRAWQLPAADCVMIGDTLGEDVLGAQSAGIYAIWMTADADTPGNRAVADSIRPDAAVSSLIELPDLIFGLDGASPRR